MELFSPDPDDVVSPTFAPDDLSSLEDIKEEDLYGEATPIQVCADVLHP